uniref:CPG4 domain-containing protein n=1 Tax=Strongyloides papillosus TaxID=174720 RepID=A0A0N5BWD7_STREA
MLFSLLIINCFVFGSISFKLSPLDKRSFFDGENGGENTSGDLSINDIFSMDENVGTEEIYTGPDECLHYCNDEIIRIVKPAMSMSMKISEKYKTICEEYDSARMCMEKRPQCPSQKFFVTATSGVKYMCEEQKDAFDATIPCITDWFRYSNAECETLCMASNLINGISIKKIFQQDFKFLEAFDPYIAKISVNEMCRVAECMLSCYKQKLNTRCDGTAGSILAEVVLRPIADVQAVAGPISPIISSVLPLKCAFLHDPSIMNQLRIDERLSKEIAKKYRLQKELPQRNVEKNEILEVQDPFTYNISNDSPLNFYDDVNFL